MTLAAAATLLLLAGTGSDDAPIRVVIVTGHDHPAHDWRTSTPALREVLETDKRFEVRVVEDPEFLESPSLERYDVIFLHFMDWKRPAPGAKARTNLLGLVERGKGLFVLHFACGAFDDWPAYRDLAGRVWDRKNGHDPRGPFRVEVLSTDHPVTLDLPSFETDDELYICLEGERPVELLATARSSVTGQDHPMAFAFSYGKGRVFHTPLGHDARAIRSSGTAELIRRGCAWAAGRPPVARRENSEETVSLLCEDGTGAAIRIAGGASEAEEAAAKELKHYLERMTGTTFPVVGQERNELTIEVGTASRVPDVEAAALGADGFLIEVTGDGVRLVGGDDRGTRYAVTTFLEDLGVRWCMPGEFGEVVPKRATLRARCGRRVEQPDFPFRQIWYAYGAQSPAGAERLAEWLRRNKVGSIPVHHGHNLTSSLPKDATLETHPEYFSLVGGRREKSQLCTTHPDVIRLVTESVIEFFHQSPEALSYSLCPDDNTDFCECERCRELDVGGIDPYTGKPLVSDRYMHFLNAVARGIQAEHPGKMVTTYAYVNYSIAPQKVSIDPHVAVMVTTSVFCSIHGIGDEHCPSRMRMRKLLSKWAAKTSQVYIYEYDPIPFNAELPCPLYGARAREMPLYKGMGIRGFSFESHQSWATLSPNYYVAAKLMWNSGADAETLLGDYCRSFFGPAAAPMVEYYQAQERAFGEFRGEVRWSLRDIPEAFSETLIESMGQALGQAEQVTSESPYRERVAMVRMAHDYLRLYLAARRVGVGGTYASFVEHHREAASAIDRMSRASEDFILADVARRYFRASLGETAGEAFAEELGLVTKWWLIGPFDNSAGGGHTRAYPPQERIDLSGRYPGKTGEVAWRQVELPAWRGYVDLAAVVTPKDWGCAYAMVRAHSPAARRAQLRLGSNDSVVVWLNGKKVHDNNILRTARIDEDVVDVELEAGENVFLVKVCQTALDWGFYFRITDREGRALEDLRYGRE